MPPTMTLHRIEPAVALLEVAGRIDDPSDGLVLRENLSRATGAGGVRHLVVDLARLESLDPTGLGALIGACRRMKAAGGTVRLAGLTGRPGEIFALAGLAKVIPTASDATAALEQIRSGSGGGGGCG